jgi:hypothetical protein
LPIYPVDGYRDFIREAVRVTVNEGYIVGLNITPGWYGGELDSVIQDEEAYEAGQNKIFVDEFGFQYEDFETNQEYGSLEKIVSTYGFIFGQNAIEYLRKHGKTDIKWMFRIHSKQVEK